MCTVKRILSFLLVAAMLSSMLIVVSADASEVIQPQVLHSITVDEDTGKGLAFMIQMNVKGAQVNARNEFVNTTATATVDGVEYDVVKMGAVMANQAVYIADLDDLTLEDVNAARTVLDVPAKYLCAVPEADSCTFAVRITNLPAKALGRAIACRPYIVLADSESNEFTLYGVGDIYTYNTQYYTAAPEETPVLNVAIANVDDRLAASATAEYVAYETVTYAEAFRVALTLENISANAQTSAGDYVEYTFYDADGGVLGAERVVVDVLNPGDSKTVEFYAPIGTASIEATDSSLHYVPAITLPAIGSDIDVTKMKNRIRVSATSAAFNEDGTIAVSMTFKNYTTNWITEETDYVKYTCYDKDGTPIKTATLYIGCIDTKKNPTKTFHFTVPADVAELKITSSKIVYWTEWA